MCLHFVCGFIADDILLTLYVLRGSIGLFYRILNVN